MSFELVYSPESRSLIAPLLNGRETAPQAFARLQIRNAQRALIDVAAHADVIDHPEWGRCVRIVKFPLNDTLRRLEQLSRENEVLSSIVSTARDASYCVDFIEPVDLTAPEHEIIRQVFENQCCWRYCNEAMARLYKLPIGGNLNTRDVHEVFPRNADNENFVRTLIQNRWNVDGALSRDHRYDGVDVLIENDVRADIREGQLYRFWGVVRELSARRMQERELEGQAAAALDILAAVADPVIVADAEARIVGANPAVEWVLGWPAESLLGRGLKEILRTRLELRRVIAAARPGRLTTWIEADAQCRDGTMVPCGAFISSIHREDHEARSVFTLRMDPAIVMDKAS
jgi:PAS domain S-box-containing protein